MTVMMFIGRFGGRDMILRDVSSILAQGRENILQVVYVIIVFQDKRSRVGLASS